MSMDDESQEENYSLEDILAEFSTRRTSERPKNEPPHPSRPQESASAPKRSTSRGRRELPETLSFPSVSSAQPSVPETPTRGRRELPETPETSEERSFPAPPTRGRRELPEDLEDAPQRAASPPQTDAPTHGRRELAEEALTRTRKMPPSKEHTQHVPSEGKRRRSKPSGTSGEDTWKTQTIRFPLPPKQPDTYPTAGKKSGVVTTFPGSASGTSAKPSSPPSKSSPKAPPIRSDQEDDTKVLEFPPQKPVNRVAVSLDRLRRRADDFAGHMFEAEGIETDEEIRHAEEMIPGVDEEEEEAPPRPRRKPLLPPAPDIPPAELGKRYERGLQSRRLRRDLVFVVFLASIYLTLAEHMSLPIPASLAENAVWRCWSLAALQSVAMLLGADTLLRGLIRPFQLRMGMDTLAALANIAVLADAITLPRLAGESVERQPYCAISILSIFFIMWGELLKRRGQRIACRAAAAASEPYLVTRDEGAWNGRDTYAKGSGSPVGFGSQMQGADGAERIYLIVTPLLLVASFLFSVISSLGKQRPQDLLWCLAVTLTASASLSGTLCFGQPWHKLSARLAKSGAALAGWEGVTNTTGASNLLFYDQDLFPPGSVSLNGIKIYGNFPSDKVISDTATVIRDAGSGLEKVFHDLLRAQGAVYRRGKELKAFESGGLSELIRGEQVLVGSAAFMSLMNVPLPPGLNVKNAVFCAIDEELAGVFALSYHLSPAAAPAIDSLIRNHITPVLATRDFNLTPDMLQSRFKLPADRMEFPSVERRRELSDFGREHSDTLTAVLCREGISPYAEAVVGGKRLRSAVRLSAGLACLGSVAGLLLTFYLTAAAAYSSLTPTNLLTFLLMWFVPAPLISGWVDRY